ncbi:hypothetical protein D3C72_954940 [compost metagenome]
MQLLVFGGTLRCLFGLLGQIQRQLELPAALQHANEPRPRTRISAFTVEIQGHGEIRNAFAMLAHLEQQLAAPALQPGIVQRQALDAPGHLFQRFTGFELLLVRVQQDTGIHVLAAAQAAGLGAEFDFFVGVDTQVGQDELRPVLIQVAEEHQAQAIAQFHDGQAEQALIEPRAPVVEALRLGKLFAQCWQPIGFPAFGLIDDSAKGLEDFTLEQQFEQFLDRQRHALIDPTECQQRAGGAEDIADFVVMQFAGPEMNALAHDHSDQQCLRFTGQPLKLINETQLVNAQYIGKALLKPIKHLHEVVQVVERIVEGICGHRKWAMASEYWLCVQIPVPPCPVQSEKDKWRRCTEYFPGSRTFCPQAAPTAIGMQ